MPHHALFVSMALAQPAAAAWALSVCALVAWSTQLASHSTCTQAKDGGSAGTTPQWDGPAPPKHLQRKIARKVNFLDKVRVGACATRRSVQAAVMTLPPWCCSTCTAAGRFHTQLARPFHAQLHCLWPSCHAGCGQQERIVGRQVGNLQETKGAAI